MGHRQIFINKNNAQLLRDYRIAEVKSFLCKHELLGRIETFTYDFHDDYDIVFDVFLNDSGKYIVFHLYNPSYFTDEFIKSFCREFKVTYETVTREIVTDNKGSTRVSDMATYLFEIIKGE